MRYIGDGVYASLDEAGQIWLRTETGDGRVHSIALEPAVLSALDTFVRDCVAGHVHPEVPPR